MRQHLLHFLIASVLVLVVVPVDPRQIAAGALTDPDSYMRLVRMQEAFDHGHWFGYVVARDASGWGQILSWSHLLDAGLLMLRAPLLLVLPPDRALLWAAAISGPVSVGLLGLFCAWAAAPLTQPGWRWPAAVSIATAPPIFGYGQFGSATHHVELTLLAVAVWAAAGRAAFGDLRAGAMAGLSAALGIWLSPEAMPFAMMGFSAVFLSWIARPGPAVAAALAAAGSVFLGGIAFAVAVDPPFAGYAAPELDRISLVFLCLAAIVCALCWLPWAITARRLSLPARLAACAGAGAAGLALWLSLFPGYLLGLNALMTAEEAAALFPNNAEWQPLDTPALFASVAGPGTLAVIAAFAFALRRRGTLAGLLWAYAGLCGAGCVALAALHVRFAPYQAAGAAMLLPVLLSRAGSPAVRAWGPLIRPGLLAAFVVGPVLAGSVYSPEVSYSSTEPVDAKPCSMADAAQLLAPLGDAVVMADLNLGPELLYRTRVKVVGSLYLRGTAGAMRLRAAWRARDLEGVPAALRAAGVQYVLACPGTRRSPFVDGPETTLFDRLNNREPPPWLKPRPGLADSAWALYEVAAQ
jgi:hypothetical protein